MDLGVGVRCLAGREDLLFLEALRGLLSGDLTLLGTRGPPATKELLRLLAGSSSIGSSEGLSGGGGMEGRHKCLRSSNPEGGHPPLLLEGLGEGRRRLGVSCSIWWQRGLPKESPISLSGNSPLPDGETILC